MFRSHKTSGKLPVAAFTCNDDLEKHILNNMNLTASKLVINQLRQFHILAQGNFDKIKYTDEHLFIPLDGDSTELVLKSP